MASKEDVSLRLDAPEPLGAAHSVAAFDCGEPALDEWLKRRALANQLSGASRTFVVTGPEGLVYGYYAMAAGAVSHQQATSAVRRNMPDPVPVMVLARLAVDRRAQGIKLGASLLQDAVNRAVAVALGGETVGTMVEGNRRCDSVVRLPDKQRADESVIAQLPVRVGESGLLPLGEVVDFRREKVVEPIAHELAQRKVGLMISVKDRDMESFVHEADARLEAELKLPDGYSFEFGGSFKNLNEARQRLAVVVPAALALILLLIFMSFRSLRQTLVIATGIPLALTGGIAALWLRDMPFSITAAVGFIALSGVAVLNGLVMVTCFNDLLEEGRSLRDAVVEGSLLRLRPVLMTALVAALGFIPMAIATGAGAEVQRPLATVVIGGILSSTLLTLILLPALFYIMERRPASTLAEVGAGPVPAKLPLAEEPVLPVVCG